MKKILFSLALTVCICGGSLSVGAEDAPVASPILNAPFFQEQFNVKQLYREAWEIDNGSRLSSIDQLEYIQANNPGLDADTMAIVKQGTALLKKMKFGLKDADMVQDSAAIRQNPLEMLAKISGNISTDATSADALSVINLIEPTQRLMDRVMNEKKLTRKGYRINIDSF